MADTRRWVWIGGVVLLCVFVFLLHSILTPFLVALLLAYLFDPVVDRLEKIGLSRTWGVVAVFALFTLIITALVLVLVPMLAKQLFKLYELAPQMLDWLQHTAMPWAQAKLGLADGFWKFDKVKAAISEHMGQTTDIVGVVLSQATASSLALIGWLTNLVLIPVVAFYLLRDWDIMMAKIRGTITETYDNVEMNPTLAAEDFNYPVPRGVRLNAAPQFNGSRAANSNNSQRNACINNLSQLVAAKNEWALEKSKKVGDEATEADLKPYLKLDADGNLPKCPGGGKYTLGKVGENPTCSIAGHVLP